jgi:ABC-type antimicrobial peptide transport system permease subunit
MSFSDYLALALRSLSRSRLRSGLTIAAIVIGATGVTIMLTFVTSVKNYVVNQFVSTGQIRQVEVSQTPNLTYAPTGNNFPGGGPAPAAQGPGATPSAELNDALEAKIRALPHVTGVAAQLQGGGQNGLAYMALGSTRVQVPNLTGDEANGVFSLSLVAGRNLRQGDTADVVLVSAPVADALGLKGRYAQLVGQTVTLHTDQGYTGVGATLPTQVNVQPCSPGPGARLCGPTAGLSGVDLPATVIGVMSAEGLGPGSVVVPLSWLVAISNGAVPNGLVFAQQLQGGKGVCPNGQPGCQAAPPPGGIATVTGGWSRQTTAQFVANMGGYQTFLVNVDATNNVAAVATAINHLGVSTATGLDALNQQKRKADIIGLVLGALGLVALIIAALGVMNTMVMSILERTREIGVMRALGARRSTIRRLYTVEAAGLGFFGGLFGVIIGFVFVVVGRTVITHAVKTSKIAGASFSVPIWLIVVVIAGTTAIGFLSGVIPARRAAALDPVEALRYE